MIKNGFRFLAKGLSSTLRGCNLTSKLPGNGKCVRQLESTYMDNVSDQRTYNLPHAHEYSIPTKKVQRSSFLPFVIKGSSCIDTCLLRSAIQNNMSMDNVNDPRTYNLTHVHEYSTPTKKVQRSNFLPFVIKGSSCIDTCLLRSAIQNNMSVVANKPHVSLSAYSFKNDNVNRMFPRSVTTKVDCLNINGMPFLGMDMGGTLTKLVFFEPNDSSTKRTENELLSNVTKYLMKNSTYGKYGHRDAHLQMDNVKICNRIGTLHFITFPTSEMNNFLDLCKKIGMADSVSTICATAHTAKKYDYHVKIMFFKNM